MPTRHRNRIVSFDVVDDHLEMTVRFPDVLAQDYVHRCTREIYQAVAHTIEEHAAPGSDGTTLEELVAKMDAPFTQVNVALAFLKERGCVEVRRRRTYPASAALYEDAMVEFCYLADAPY
jgi:transcription initiation factor IIE alpha subunit